MKIMQNILTVVFAAVLLLLPATPVLAAGTTIPSNTTREYTCSSTTSPQKCLKDNPIVKWINFFINLLAVIIFIGATAMLIFAGLQYAASADNPQRVQDAKKKITSVILGLVAFFFLYAFMQWLIPGGIF